MASGFCDQWRIPRNLLRSVEDSVSPIAPEVRNVTHHLFDSRFMQEAVKDLLNTNTE